MFFGRLFRALEETGQLENTLVWRPRDNGPGDGELAGQNPHPLPRLQGDHLGGRYSACPASSTGRA